VRSGQAARVEGHAIDAQRTSLDIYSSKKKQIVHASVRWRRGRRLGV